jgi:hypothetical protein
MDKLIFVLGGALVGVIGTVCGAALHSCMLDLAICSAGAERKEDALTRIRREKAQARSRIRYARSRIFDAEGDIEEQREYLRDLGQALGEGQAPRGDFGAANGETAAAA